MNKKLLILFLFIGVLSVKGQVLNIENLRIATDTSGFAGSIGLNVQLTKNTRNITVFGSNIYIQYRKHNHLFFFLNNISYKNIDEVDIVNFGTNHLRYNYKLNKTLTLEAFFQSQYNSISKIDQRHLAGGGLRIKLLDHEKYSIYLGNIIMYEHEKIDNQPPIYNDDVRLSEYLTFRLFPTDNISFTSSTFYQPRIDDFGDYRIYSQNTFRIKVIKKLAFQVSYTIAFDKFPVEGVPNTQYDLLNGLIYTFD